MLQKMITLMCCMTVFFNAASSGAHASKSDDKPGFFERHKRLKKLLVVGGVGAVTGGVGAAVMGGSVATGAATGAGTRVAVHEAKDKYKKHKHRRH